MISKPKAAWLFGLAAFYCLIAMHIYWPNRGGSGFYLPWNLVGGIFIALTILGAMLFSRPPLAACGCARCYQSPHQTMRHRQMTVLVLNDRDTRYSHAHPALFSINLRDDCAMVRNKLQMALELFCQQPWVAMHASDIWKCRQCRIAALSSCEKKVLKLMSTGMSACTIAGMLDRSQKTISAHKRSAMRKLNVNKNTELNKMLLNQMGLN